MSHKPPRSSLSQESHTLLRVNVFHSKTPLDDVDVIATPVLPNNVTFSYFCSIIERHLKGAENPTLVGFTCKTE